MVKLTLEFQNIDAAIVALGKLAGAPSVPAKRDTGTPQGAVTDAPAARRGRSDKGQKREPYKPRATEAKGADVPALAGSEGSAKQAEAPAVEGPAVGVAPLVTATRADAQAALEALVSQVNLDAGIKLLAEFGTQRLRDLPDEKLGAFVEKAKAALPKAAA